MHLFLVFVSTTAGTDTYYMYNAAASFAVRGHVTLMWFCCAVVVACNSLHWVNDLPVRPPFCNDAQRSCAA